MDKLSSDGRVGFQEKEHIYYDTQTGEVLSSVSSFIAKYKQGFDSVGMAQKVAKREGVSLASILQMWEDKKNLACESGTYIHNALENAMKRKPFDLSKNYAKTGVAKKFIKEVIETGKIKPILVEPIVYDLDLKIAGQIDLVGETDKGRFIFDYKTNEKLREFNHFAQMKPPFRELSDCNFNHYQIQLNAYRELLNMDLAGMFIIHFDFFEYKFKKVKEFPCFPRLSS